MLITGKKRPFCFVLKQQKPLNRGKRAVFHIKTPCHPGAEGDRVHRKGVGEESPCLQPCPSVTLERSDRVQGKSSVTPSPKGPCPLKPPEVSAAANALVQLAMAERTGVLQTPESE